MKVLKKSVIKNKNQVEHTKTERSVLGRVDHPFIVGLKYAFQTVRVRSSLPCSAKNSTSCWTIVPAASCSTTSAGPRSSQRTELASTPRRSRWRWSISTRRASCIGRRAASLSPQRSEARERAAHRGGPRPSHRLRAQQGGHFAGGPRRAVLLRHAGIPGSGDSEPHGPRTGGGLVESGRAAVRNADRLGVDWKGE